MKQLNLTDTADRNLGRILQMQAKANGDTVYLRQGERCVSFSQADGIVSSIARGLADLGVGRGDRVAFFMKNDIEVVFLTLAVNRIGAVWIPINTEYKGEWLRDLLVDSRAAVIVSDTVMLPVLAPVIDKVPYDHVLILGKDGGQVPDWALPYEMLKAHSDTPFAAPAIDYSDVNAVLWTSGTTGKSKGVMQSHNIWVRSAENNRVVFDTRPGEFRRQPTDIRDAQDVCASC